MSTPFRRLFLALLLCAIPALSGAQALLFAPATQRLIGGVLVAQPNGQYVVSPTPGVVLSVQPDGSVQTRPATAIASWELATMVAPTLLRYDGAGTARFVFVQLLAPPAPPVPVEPANVRTADRGQVTGLVTYWLNYAHDRNPNFADPVSLWVGYVMDDAHEGHQVGWTPDWYWADKILAAAGLPLR